MQSVIYQWNGQEFVVFQNVATRGASKLKFFKIGNESFLAIVNLDNFGQETVDLVIYKRRNNSFDKFSEIPPTLRKFGGAASFAIKNKTFISFRGYSLGGEEVSGTGFSRLQTMQKYEARDVKTFQMNGQIFLQTKLVMEGNPTFLRGMEMSLFQSSHFLLLEPLPGMPWHPFVTHGQTFLGLADTYGKSIVYQAIGSRFVKYQEFQLSGLMVQPHLCREVTHALLYKFN